MALLVLAVALSIILDDVGTVSFSTFSIISFVIGLLFPRLSEHNAQHIASSSTLPYSYLQVQAKTAPLSTR